eukprot:272722-Pelagomonas_calceolata.AAC.1
MNCINEIALKCLNPTMNGMHTNRHKLLSDFSLYCSHLTTRCCLATSRLLIHDLITDASAGPSGNPFPQIFWLVKDEKERLRRTHPQLLPSLPN